ncbi:MAG: dihydrodipicolinate synthase family protein [Acidimicrobiia bacterium]
MRNPPHLLTALVTPFTRSGEVDLDAHRFNLRILTDRGIKGFLIGGSTGEGPYLDPGEREALTSAARQDLGNRPFLLVGVAGESERVARAQAEEAAAAGADAVLVLTPTTMVRGNHAAVVGFFRDVADASPVPVFLYSVPAVTGYTLPSESAIELSQHPNIAGMKDSTGDPVAMAGLVEYTANDFLLMTGASRAVTLAIAAGANGAITASSNYVPELANQVVAAARRSPRSAANLQSRLTRLSAAVETYRVPGVKVAAGLVELRPGYPRKPLRQLPIKDRKMIEKALRREGIL